MIQRGQVRLTEEKMEVFCWKGLASPLYQGVLLFQSNQERLSSLNHGPWRMIQRGQVRLMEEKMEVFCWKEVASPLYQGVLLL